MALLRRERVVGADSFNSESKSFHVNDSNAFGFRLRRRDLVRIEQVSVNSLAKSFPINSTTLLRILKSLTAARAIAVRLLLPTHRPSVFNDLVRRCTRTFCLCFSRTYKTMVIMNK